MSDRITEIKVEDLTLEHLWCSVEVARVGGQLLRYDAHISGGVSVTLGPAQCPTEFAVPSDATIKVLDAPQPERKTFNFGASE